MCIICDSTMKVSENLGFIDFVCDCGHKWQNNFASSSNNSNNDKKVKFELTMP